MNPKILIIILNWNGWANTIECLESFFQNNYKNFDIIVVDNNSEDNSVDKIKDYCYGKIRIESKYIEQLTQHTTLDLLEFTKEESERILNIDNFNNDTKLIIIKNDQNYGFTEGNNIGIRFGLKNLDPDYFLIINNDVIVTKNFLEILVSYHHDKEFALSQPKILNYHSENIIESTGGLADKFGSGIARGYTELDKFQYDTVKKDDFFYVLGTCLLTPKKFVKKLNSELNPDEFFDKVLFAVHEDFDISWQARLLGYNIIYCPDMICYHKGHQSFNKKPSLTFNALLQRNKIRIIIKNYSSPYLIVFLPAMVILEFVVSLLTSLKRKNLDYIKILLQGMMWNIKNREDTLQKRKLIQQRRKIPDSEITKSMKNISTYYNWIKRGD